MNISDWTANWQQSASMKRNPSLKKSENKTTRQNEQQQEQFEQQQWSYACSQTFNNNMYGSDQLP
jgi:hypothetical protein